MSIYQAIIDFFGIVPLESTATFIDVINEMLQLFTGIFLVAFFIRSLFLIVAIPDSSLWR